MAKLSHSKQKYDWFKKAVTSTIYRLNIVRIYAQNVPRVLGHKSHNHAEYGAKTYCAQACYGATGR